MAGSRPKLFGPMTLIGLALVPLAALFSGYLTISPKIHEAWELRALAGAIQGNDDRAREQAIVDLSMREPARALPALLEAARDLRPKVRAMASRGLATLGVGPETTLPPLLAAAADPDESVRKAAAWGLGRLPTRLGAAARSGPEAQVRAKSLKAIRALLADPAPGVREEAANSLGAYGPDDDSARALIAAAADRDRRVRQAAGGALRHVRGPGDPETVRVLLGLLAEREPADGRRVVLEWLVDAGDPARRQAADTVLALLDDKDDDVRGEAIGCLDRLGPEAVATLPMLRRLRADEDSLLHGQAGMAIATIAGSDSEEGIAVLVAMIGDDQLQPMWRQEALVRLHEASPADLPRATPALIRQLAEPSTGLRQLALEMLAQIVDGAPAQLTESPTTAGAP